MELAENYKLGELIIAISKGEITAISELYSIIGKAMKATAYSYLRNIADAEDVVQDALIIIVQKANRFHENKNAKAWIHTIVSNLAKNKVNSLKRRRDYCRKVCLDYQNDLFVQPEEDTIIISEIFDRLTEKERQYIIYKFWYDCSFAEMAKIFHKSKTNVNYRFNRIIKKIKNFYNSDK